MVHCFSEDRVSDSVCVPGRLPLLHGTLPAPRAVGIEAAVLGGVEAAARSLLQAVVFQPSARNATLSISGGWPTSGELSDRKWDDLFLRLNGPELFRISGLADTASGETELDARYDRLVQYVLEWGEMFEGGASGGTGLTTPVQLRPSHKDASEAEGSVRRSGV